MSDAQVSNARRILFTALALGTLWVLAWRAYWIGSGGWYDCHGMLYFSWWVGALAPSLSLSLVPVGLISISAHNSPLNIIRDRSIWGVWLVLVCVLGFCHRLGEHDAEAAFAACMADKPEPISAAAFTALFVVARRAHATSWLWVILPIILATAFVIFTAWRRAVFDVDVEAEDDRAGAP